MSRAWDEQYEAVTQNNGDTSVLISKNTPATESTHLLGKGKLSKSEVKAALDELELPQNQAVMMRHLKRSLGFTAGGSIIFIVGNVIATFPSFSTFLAAGDFGDVFGVCVLGMANNATIQEFSDSLGAAALIANNPINTESMTKLLSFIALMIPGAVNKFPTRMFLWPKAVISAFFGLTSISSAILPAYMNIDFKNSETAPSWYAGPIPAGLAIASGVYLSAQLMRVVVTKIFGSDERINATRTAIINRVAESMQNSAQVQEYLKIMRTDYVDEKSGNYSPLINYCFYLVGIGITGLYNYTASVVGTQLHGSKLWGDNAFNDFIAGATATWRGIFLAGPIAELIRFAYNYRRRNQEIEKLDLKKIDEMFQRSQLGLPAKATILLITFLFAGYSMGSASSMVRKYWLNDPDCKTVGSWKAVGEPLVIAISGSIGVNWRDIANLSLRGAENIKNQYQKWRGYLTLCKDAIDKNEVKDICVATIINGLRNSTDFELAYMIESVGPVDDSVIGLKPILTNNQILVTSTSPDPDNSRWYHTFWKAPTKDVQYLVTLKQDVYTLLTKFEEKGLNFSSTELSGVKRT